MNGESGFSLVEVLVALVILGIGASSLLVSSQYHAERTAGIRDRIVARWVAEDRLTALRLRLGQPDTTTMMGTEWRVDTDFSGTSDPDLQRVDIAVSRREDGATLTLLSGFLDTGSEAK